MKFLHSMIRAKNIDDTIHFYRDLLGLKLLRSKDYPGDRFSLYFFATHEGESEIEVTHNWDDREYQQGDNFGHLAFLVEDIYELCGRLSDRGVSILRPPRDGYMAFVKDPNGISIELLQQGGPRPPADPWREMPNHGSW